jgi:hypothetical protein
VKPKSRHVKGILALYGRVGAGANEGGYLA